MKLNMAVLIRIYQSVTRGEYMLSQYHEVFFETVFFYAVFTACKDELGLIRIIYICTYVYTYVCMYVCMYVCVYVYACMYVSVCMYVCMYICMHV